MKKLIICSVLSLFAFAAVQAGECKVSKECKDAKSACVRTSGCPMKKNSCGAKSCCAKSAPKVKSPKAAEQSGK
ncbi:MAG TPA: hypothetical protein VK327_05885 [Candidatus Paceibacterota bacterium]|nr:hypothetical protein [Candidatus Paceibacterota bacterium]